MSGLVDVTFVLKVDVTSPLCTHFIYFVQRRFNYHERSN